MQLLKLSRLLLVCSALSACTLSSIPRVDDKSLQPPIPHHYLVKKGDTLYSIAWRFGLDYQQVADLNGIPAPYLIHPAQRLRLTATQQAATPKTSRARKTAAPPTPPNNTAAAPPNQPPPQHWNWPAQGNLVAKFSKSKGILGIHIAGKPGSPVQATAAGDVIYVGEDLRGYGKLVIIQHNREFLSAYAHNRRILVQRGQRVAAQQRIAEMGSSDASRNMLHFEIRQFGQPVNPLKYLKR